MRYLLPLAILVPGTAVAQDAEPTEIFWYYGHNGEPPGQAFITYMTNQFNATVTESDSWPAASDWSDFRLVVLGRPKEPYSAEMIADLQAHIDDYGMLVIAADNNEAGDEVISTANAILAALRPDPTDPDTIGLGMQLVDPSLPEASYTATDNDGNPICDTMNITAVSPFFQIPPSIESIGNISGTTSNGAQILVSDTYNINGISTTFRVAARNGLVLLTADFSFWGGDSCGQAAREALWENLWEIYCDRDEDDIIASVCGGFDCNDFDGAGHATFAYADLDGDGFGGSRGSCGPDATDSNTDCDDDNPMVNPAAEEVCDGLDNDCDTYVDALDDDLIDGQSYYPDQDGDGFGRDGNPTVACENPDPTAWSTLNTDCDDGDPTIFPGAEEVCDNDEDDDCDGEIDESCVTPPPGPEPPPPEERTCGCTGTPVGLFGFLPLATGLLAIRRR